MLWLTFGPVRLIIVWQWKLTKNTKNFFFFYKNGKSNNQTHAKIIKTTEFLEEMLIDNVF